MMSSSSHLQQRRCHSSSLLLSVSALVLLLLPLQPVCGQMRIGITNFTLDQIKPEGNVRGLKFVSRFLAPFGPPPGAQPVPGQPLQGYGFGMGAIEATGYDEINQYLYTVSAQGYVSVADYANPAKPQLTNIVMDFTEVGEISDIAICSKQGWIFLSNLDTHTVSMYETVKRPSAPGDQPTEPKFITAAGVSLSPEKLLPNTNCTILAVNHEHQTDILYGEVSLIRDLDFQSTNKDGLTATAIPLDNAGGHGDAEQSSWDDDYILRKGLHMPLTKAAMEYWDEYSPLAEEIDFSQERANYRSSLFIVGESLSWSPNQEELLVNLQQNNGLLRIDVANNRALDLAGFGLKNHAQVAIDINGNDQQCNLKTYPNLFSMRNPDIITTFQYNGQDYVMTANEGQFSEYNGFEDSIRAKNLFQGQTFGLPQFDVWPNVFNASDALGGPNAAPFNNQCEGTDRCVGNVKVSLGSSAIDYEVDPTNPVFERMVLFGGRGWTIYELPDNPHALLKLVYDSGDTIEREICQQYPWAHNTELDDVYAPAANFPNNTLWQLADEDDRAEIWEYNDPNQMGCVDQGDGTPGACPYSQTVDRTSEKDGPAVELVTSGVACGRLISLVTTEKNGVALLYDMTDITSPTLIQLFHLSPGTKDRSPGLAYNDGTIGEVDPEIAIFMDDKDSPSGKAAVFIVGAHSGSVSFWEFDCVDSDPESS